MALKVLFAVVFLRRFCVLMQPHPSVAVNAHRIRNAQKVLPDVNVQSGLFVEVQHQNAEVPALLAKNAVFLLVYAHVFLRFQAALLQLRLSVVANAR